MASPPAARTAAPTTLPLAGARVVDLSRGVSGPFAARWLAALGADVLALEPPGGDPARRRRSSPDAPADPERSGFFLYLGAGKRSAVLDLAAPAARDTLLGLAAGADLLLHSLAPAALERLGLASDRFAARNPGLSVVSVTPFGATGPDRDHPATNLTLAARAGLPWHLGAVGQPPLLQGGPQVEYLAGLHTLGAALCGLLRARRRGVGVHFDLAQLECAASLAGHFTARVTQTGEEWPARRQPRALWRLYRCADGWAGICGLRRNYPRLAEVTGIDAIRDASPFLEPGLAREAEERLTALLSRWFAPRKRSEIRELARRERVPLGVAYAVADLVESPQLHARAFFHEVEHPRAGPLVVPAHLWRSDAHGWSAGRAPLLGEQQRDIDAGAEPWRAARLPRPAPQPDAAAEPPLAGIRVLDLGQIWAGPYAAMLLADQGADVIKVESPRACDPNRLVAPPPPDHGAPWWNTGAYFCEYNHNKRGLGLDYAAPRGREVLARLVSHCDVVIENFRADVLDKLGIGYAWLREQRPDVILLSMAAFGKTGPERDLPGYGPLIEQSSGLAALSGYDDEAPPAVAGYAYGDPVAATAGASAVLAALVQREQTGRGQHIDLAQREVAACLLGEVFAEWSQTRRQPPRLGNAHPTWAPHGLYPCRGENAWVAIAVRDDAEWTALRTALGDPEWARADTYRQAAGRVAARREIDARLAVLTRRLDREEVVARCGVRGVPAAPLRRMREVPRDPQLCSRGLYETVRPPDTPPWRAHGRVWRGGAPQPCIERRAPDFGGHNREVLIDLLGLPAAEVAELARAGIVTDIPRDLPTPG